MRIRVSRRIFALLLGVVLALGTLSSLQTGGMAGTMALSSDMGASEEGGCDGCGGSADEDAQAGACPSLCITSAVAVLPTTPALPFQDATGSGLPENSFSHGTISPPDPSPPRPGNRG